jgi:hypothetical protein
MDGVNERELGETGLREAIERLRDRLTPEPTDDPLIPLAEALTWCYSLDEYHRGRLTNYFALRDGTLGGDTLAGLIYARGFLTVEPCRSSHLLSRATLLEHGEQRAADEPVQCPLAWPDLGGRVEQSIEARCAGHLRGQLNRLAHRVDRFAEARRWFREPERRPPGSA